MRRQRFHKSGMHVPCHPHAVAAHKYVRPRRRHHRCHLLGALCQLVLHVHLLWARAAERGDEFRDGAVRGKPLEVLTIQKILVSSAAPEKQPRRTRGGAYVHQLQLRAPALEESPKRRHSCPRPDHDHRRCGVLWRLERPGTLDVHRHLEAVFGANASLGGGGGNLAVNPVRRHTRTLHPRSHRVLDHRKSYGRSPRVCLGGGGDGVKTRLQRLQRVQQLGPPRCARRVLVEKIQQRGGLPGDARSVRLLAPPRAQQQQVGALGRFGARLGQHTQQGLAWLPGEIQRVGQCGAHCGRAAHVWQWGRRALPLGPA
mmetsp:Transcript_17164/g.42428  ORF Transcript_17164/g.42428 Transcript_17164/m.42428 type:complete len:314 (+) Transcript_17164:658-1599(+)